MEMNCFKCDKEIPQGQNFLSVTVSTEKVIGDSIQVMAAECVFVACLDCGIKSINIDGHEAESTD